MAGAKLGCSTFGLALDYDLAAVLPMMHSFLPPSALQALGSSGLNSFAVSGMLSTGQQAGCGAGPNCDANSCCPLAPCSPHCTHIVGHALAPPRLYHEVACQGLQGRGGAGKERSGGEGAVNPALVGWAASQGSDHSGGFVAAERKPLVIAGI